MFWLISLYRETIPYSTLASIRQEGAEGRKFCPRGGDNLSELCDSIWWVANARWQATWLQGRATGEPSAVWRKPVSLHLGAIVHSAITQGGKYENTKRELAKLLPPSDAVGPSPEGHVIAKATSCHYSEESAAVRNHSSGLCFRTDFRAEPPPWKPRLSYLTCVPGLVREKSCCICCCSRMQHF